MTGHKGGTPRFIPTVFRETRGPPRVSLQEVRSPSRVSFRETRAGLQATCGLVGDGRGQLEAGADPGLGVGAAEVALVRLPGHDQGLRDLTFGVSLSRLTAHPPLR